MSQENQEILKKHLKFTKERDWDQFQNPKNLSMALSVEASELLEIFMWLNEKQAIELKPSTVHAAGEELADIFIYLLRLAHVLGIDLIDAAHKKMEKNIQKYPVEMAIALSKRAKMRRAK